jgi:subtilisin family serine protease
VVSAERHDILVHRAFAVKCFAGVAVALLCAGGASPLSAQGGVPVIPARAFAFDTVVTRVDSLEVRARRDSVVTVQRNGPQVVILTGPRKHLADSLPVWCQSPCVWEWDEVVSVGAAVDAPFANTWGVNAIGAPAAWNLGATGRGVIVTSLDSGIDPNHPGYVVSGGYNAVARADTGWADDISGCRGHGTHVAGTAAGKFGYGVAPGATLFGVKVFEPIPCGAYTSSQIAGLNWAVAHGSRCINISISGSQSYSVNAAVMAARALGVLVFRANGNSGTTPPQGTLGEIQTASLGGGLNRSGFSNYGNNPPTDLAAPGEGVESTMPGGGYGGKSGTSMAAPHGAGACALVLSVRPDLSADALESLLKATAQPLDTLIPNDFTGFGMVRPDLAIAALAQQGPSVAAAPRLYTTTQTECEAVNGTMPFTATTDAAWLTVWTTADRRVCWTADLTRAPQGTTTDRIYLRSMP